MSVCFECCVLSGRGLCDELITRPEESYRLLCVVVYDIEKKNLVNEEGQGHLGGYRDQRKKNRIKYTFSNCAVIHCHLWPAPALQIFPRIISQTARFSKKRY